MNRLMTFCFAAAASLLCAQAAAQTQQTMYKCKDAAGKITYTGSECHLLGLTPGGEVTGRASVTPALKFDPPPRPVESLPPPPPMPSGVADAPLQPGDSGALKPGDRRCFVVKTAKGNATRCNDTPESTD